MSQEQRGTTTITRKPGRITKAIVVERHGSARIEAYLKQSHTRCCWDKFFITMGASARDKPEGKGWLFNRQACTDAAKFFQMLADDLE